MEEEGVVARKPVLEGPGVIKPFSFRKMTIFPNEVPSVVPLVPYDGLLHIGLAKNIFLISSMRRFSSGIRTAI